MDHSTIILILYWYWRTESLLLEIQLNLFGDPASTNFINDPYVVGLENT